MHGHVHNHHHHGTDSAHGERRLLWAVALNVALTVVEVVAGILAGSLSLVADAVHNLGDASALVVAYVARRIAGKQPDQRFTFGYRRAELIGAMINLTTLIVIGLYLLYAAALRFFEPVPIQAGWVMLVAGIALAIDLGTAACLFRSAKGSLNVRAAFVHNLSDALASIAVLAGAVAIEAFGWIWLDPLLTAAIAVYVLRLSVAMLKRTASILMQAVPSDLDLSEVVSTLAQQDEVVDVHHVHAWQVCESQRAFEAHVVLSERAESTMAARQRLRALLAERFGITHTTLELEVGRSCCPQPTSEHGCHDTTQHKPA